MWVFVASDSHGARVVLAVRPTSAVDKRELTTNQFHDRAFPALGFLDTHCVEDITGLEFALALHPHGFGMSCV